MSGLWHRAGAAVARSMKPIVFVAAAVPALRLVAAAFAGDLGANPIDRLTDVTGTWTLRFLLITLAVTPVRRMTGWNRLIGLRRMLGLFAFFYGCLHFGTYIVLDQFFAWDFIVADVAKRPYITAGFTAFVLMVPLAITSTRAMIRRLGHRWQQLHRLVYVSAAAGVIHYLWLVKADTTEPMRYAAILAVLLGWRVWDMARRRRARAASSPGARPAPVTSRGT